VVAERRSRHRPYFISRVWGYESHAKWASLVWELPLQRATGHDVWLSEGFGLTWSCCANGARQRQDAFRTGVGRTREAHAI